MKGKTDFDVQNKVELLSNHLSWSYPLTHVNLSVDLLIVLDLCHKNSHLLFTLIFSQAGNLPVSIFGATASLNGEIK